MEQGKLRRMALCAVMAGVMVILAPISIPIGPVPISLAIFCVALAGAMLPPLSALTALSVYMLLGFIGLPVFSNYGAGPGVLLGPTGGYLFGYYLLVLAVSFAVKLGWKLPFQGLAAAAGMAACYLLGTLWYMAYAGVGFGAALALCVVPFILPDVLKIGVALVLARAVKRRMAKEGAV